MYRALVLAVLLCLAAPAVSSASYVVEGNPDSRPSLGLSIGKAWGYNELVSGTTIAGTHGDLDGVRMNVSLRLPLHRSITGEFGYLYDSLDFGEAELVTGLRQRYNLLSLNFRFYF